MTRAWLAAGVAAVTATALTVVPSADAPQPAGTTRVAAPPVLLAAAAEPLPVSELPDLLGDWLQRVVVAPTAAAPAPPAVDPVVGATSLGNAVVSAWNWALPWIDYGVELADYVLGFIPGGYLIGDQIDIVYFSLVRPVANSFVVDLVAPVLNEPLNPASYVNGLITLGSVTVTSLINLGINEFNYFFGWLIPPIPPLPPLRQMTVETAEEDLTMAASVESSVVTTAAGDVLTTAAEDEPAATVTETSAPHGTSKADDETADTTTSRSASGAVAAQGEVRDSGASESDGESKEDILEESEEVTDEAEDAEGITPAKAGKAETDETSASSTDDGAASTDTAGTDDAGAAGDD